MSVHRLDGLIVAFDLDNTLLDPTGLAYDVTVAEFLGKVDLGIRVTELAGAYEQARSSGRVFDRLGLRNPSHERGNPDALALLCLSERVGEALTDRIGVRLRDPVRVRRTMAELFQWERATRHGQISQRLSAEISLRRALRDPKVAELRDEVRRLAATPMISDWACTYQFVECRHPVDNHQPMIESLVSRGAVCVGIRKAEDRARAQTGHRR